MKRKILLGVLIVVFCLSLVLAACQDNKQYTATFVVNGGSAVENKTVSQLETAPSTTRSGFTFMGWYLTSDFSDGGISYPYKLTKDTTFYAKWEAVAAVEYIVAFETNGGSTIAMRSYSVIETSPVTTRSGYTFVGWYDNIELEGNHITFPYTPTKTTVLYAKWEEVPAEKFIVEFETNGGSRVKAGAYSVIENSPATTRDGFTFDGWYEDENFSGEPVSFPYAVTEQITLYAKWSDGRPKYTVSFDAHGGSAVASRNVSVIEESPSTALEGSVFVGWYDNADYSGNPISFPYTVTRDVTLHAKWEAREEGKFTVKFECGIGSNIAPRQTNSISSSPITSVSGNYRFVGWYEDADFSGSPVTFPYAVTHDVTLYAKWEETGFTLYFNSMGGTSVASLSNQLSVTKLGLPADPTNGSKVFDGWYLNEQCTQKVTYPYTLTADTTFYAKWSDPSVDPPEPVITFTVHFTDAGDSLTVTVDGQPVQTTIDNTSNDNRKGLPYVTVNDGAVISVTAPTRDGATFLGWTTTVNGTQYSVFPMEIVGNMRLYAHWQIDVEPNEKDSAELKTYLDKASNNADTFVVWYGMLIQNTSGTVDQTLYQNHYRPDKIVSGVYTYNDNVTENNGWVHSYLDFAFARSDVDDYWMTYTEDPVNGTYVYGGRWYSAEPIFDVESGFYMVYLDKLSTIDSSKFYKYDGKWYATADYVDDVGHLLLGNTSGDPANYEISYTELALTFDNDGVITDIDFKGSIVYSYDYGTGIGATIFYATGDIQILSFNPNDVLNITESQFLQDQVRPSGLYPELNPDDANRNNVASDGKAYTSEQLQSALNNLQNFTAYYTSAGNTFNGFMYNPVTITVHGNYGTVKYDDYPAYTWGEYTSSAQTARSAWTFKYDNATKAFFLYIPGDGVYCDQYSYKNNEQFNQYMLGADQAIAFNCKYPSIGIRQLNSADFTYNAQGGYFEFNGNADKLKQAGQSVFGDIDFVYPELSETENYVYLRLYMNDGKIVKVVSASTLEVPDGTEFFIREVVVTSYESDEVTLPSNVETQCIAPGEAATNGSVAGLQAALDVSKGKNHKYTDRFVFDDYDELGGVGYNGHGEDGDVYTHYNGVTQLGTNLKVYFKDGVLYEQRGTDAPTRVTFANSNINNDVRKANSYVLWAYSLAELLDADWFYQGKDGNYYGKSEYMDKLAWVLGRYSGSKQYLEAYIGMSFSSSYNAYLTLDFVSVSAGSTGISSIYYSGNIHVDGMNGSHDKPFSAKTTFSYDPSSVTVNDTPDATRPAVYQYIDADYNFNVDYDGFLNLTEVPNASGYRAYVYTYNGSSLVAEFDVTNGFDLKTVPELNAGTDVKNYRIAIKALGNDAAPVDGVIYLDGAESQSIAFELSTVPKLATPVVSLNKQDATLTVSGDYDDGTYYRFEILKNGTQVANASGNKLLSAPLDLAQYNLAPYNTYTINVFVMGTEGVIRDSATVTLLYTPERASGVSYVGELLNAINFEQSFRASFTSSATPRSNILNGSYSADQLFQAGSTWLGQNSVATTSLLMYYDKATNTGKLTFSLNGKAADGSTVKLIDIVFLFSKQGDKLVGNFVKKELDVETVNETRSLDLFFGGLSSLESDLTEESGAIDKWTGLYYRYNGDLTNADTQSAISSFSPLEELLGVELINYTGMQVTVGYNADGSMINESAVSLVGEYDDKTIIVKMVFNSFGDDLSKWSKD